MTGRSALFNLKVIYENVKTRLFTSIFTAFK
jgi:hypothetical protein